MGKEGISPFYSMECEVFLICSTPSLSWGCASPICHPMVPLQRPKATKNTTKITKFGLPIFFVSKEKNSPLKTIKCLTKFSYLAEHHSSVTLRGPLRASKQPKIPLSEPDLAYPSSSWVLRQTASLKTIKY